MAKRRGNPNWGKPEPIGPVVPTITEFEQVVKEFKLAPDQYLRSTRLREWARKNKNSNTSPSHFWRPGASRSNRLCNNSENCERGRLVRPRFICDDAMPKFEKHIFVCTNQRAEDNPRGCCNPSGNAELHQAFKAALARRGLKGKVRANQSGCLDQCDTVPTSSSILRRFGTAMYP